MVKALIVVCLFAVNCFAAVGVEVTPNSWNAGTGGAGNFTSWTSATSVSRWPKLGVKVTLLPKNINAV